MNEQVEGDVRPLDQTPASCSKSRAAVPNVTAQRTAVCRGRVPVAIKAKRRRRTFTL